MKTLLVLAFVVAVCIGIAACSRKGASDLNRRSIIVDLPPGWHEEPGKGTHVYRRDGDDSGYLHISLQPPLPQPVNSGQDAEAQLKSLLESLGMPLGEPVLFTHTESAVGIMAVAVYKSPERGMLQFWMIPSEVTIFASYNMGNLATAKQEMTEAHEIMKKVRWE